MKLKYSAKAHAYWLDGKRCKSPSAIAKVPDDSSALDKWRRRQTAIGLAMRPELLTELAANVDDKFAIDAICERAMDHAGASSGRNWGSAVHLIIERDISGQTILETPETARVRAQWQQLLADHRLEVVRAEAVIVHPELLIAGRFDQVMRCTVTGELFVMDVKTGASAHEYLHSHCVQLHLYAAAPLMATGPQGDVDFEVTEFEPMLTVSQSVAMVAHIPQDGDPSIIPVDIAAGAECFHSVIRPTWDWRNRKDLRAAWAPASAPAPAPKPAIPDPHRHGKDFGTFQSPQVATPPEEGAEVAEEQLAPLRERYKGISQAWINALRAEAVDAGCDFHLATGKTMRRLRIIDALVTLVEGDCADDDAVKALVRHVTGSDAMQWPTVSAGAAVGSLSAVEAAAFVVAAEAFVAGRFALEATLEGPRVMEVAA